MERRFGYCRTDSGPPVSLHSSQGREESRTGGRIDSISGKVRNASEEIMTKTKGNHDNDICVLMHARHEVVTRRTNVRMLRSVPAPVVYNAFAPNQRTQSVRTYFLRILAVCAAALFTAAASAQDDFSKVEIQTEKLADTVYMMTGSGGNLGVSVGEDAVFLIDDQFAPLTPKIQAAVAKLSSKPVKFVLNTHWHFDHTGGNE